MWLAAETAVGATQARPGLRQWQARVTGQWTWTKHVSRVASVTGWLAGWMAGWPAGWMATEPSTCAAVGVLRLYYQFVLVVDRHAVAVFIGLWPWENALEVLEPQFRQVFQSVLGQQVPS